MSSANDPSGRDELLNAFRAQYQHFVHSIHEAVQSGTDPVVLAWLGDDLDEYYRLTQEVSWSPFQITKTC
jgi:hypothetical protein